MAVLGCLAPIPTEQSSTSPTVPTPVVDNVAFPPTFSSTYNNKLLHR